MDGQMSGCRMSRGVEGCKVEERIGEWTIQARWMDRGLAVLLH